MSPPVTALPIERTPAFLGVTRSATGRIWRDRLDMRGTARALVTRINREINAIAEDAEVKSRALAQGTDLEAQTPERFAAFLAARESILPWIKEIGRASCRERV